MFGLVRAYRLVALPNVKEVIFLLLVGPGGKNQWAIVGQLCPYDLCEQSELIFRQIGSNVIQRERFPIWHRRRFSAAEPPNRTKIVMFAYFGS